MVNLSRTGALVRTEHHQRPGVERPLILELSQTAVTLTARVVRCEAAAVPRYGARRQYTLGLAFVNPPQDVQTAMDQVIKEQAEDDPPRFYVSFARRCPACRSRAVQKEARRQYSCSDCGHLFSGVRIGIVRFAH